MKTTMKTAMLVLAVLLAACSSTSLHPYKVPGHYAFVVAPNVLAQTQPLIDRVRDRFEQVDVVGPGSIGDTQYRAYIALEPIPNDGFAYVVQRHDFPLQKGTIRADARDADRLVDAAGGNRKPMPYHSTPWSALR